MISNLGKSRSAQPHRQASANTSNTRQKKTCRRGYMHERPAHNEVHLLPGYAANNLSESSLHGSASEEPFLLYGTVFRSCVWGALSLCPLRASLIFAEAESNRVQRGGLHWATHVRRGGPHRATQDTNSTSNSTSCQGRGVNVEGLCV